MSRHQSGSPAEWQKRRAAYKAQSGAVSNPGDGRMRAKERRMNAERRVKAALRYTHGEMGCPGLGQCDVCAAKEAK